jgi:hypothetical protein
MNRDDAMTAIVKMFEAKVKGRAPVVKKGSVHDGEAGHWLEKRFGIRPNGNNAPDLHGFELKNASRQKTTFGDWSADRYIFDKNHGRCTRPQFFRIFGAPNVDGRFSWSGSPAPKVGSWNSFGQRLILDDAGSVYAVYRFEKDKRKNKGTVVPPEMQEEEQALAIWKSDSLKSRLEAKFGNFGWFKCLLDDTGVYAEIVFGDPMNFDAWIEDVRSGEVYLDSGMKEDNPRPYSSWRANNSYWDNLIVSRFK